MVRLRTAGWHPSVCGTRPPKVAGVAAACTRGAAGERIIAAVIRLASWAVALLSILSLAQANEAPAWAALRGGGVVALMRHASAPGGTGDPPGFRLDDCTTQRNLDAQGRADARAVGAKLRAERVRFARVLSSPWCRCVDTARLLDAGAVQTEATFSNVVVLADQREALSAGARRLIEGWAGPGSLLVVTHGANIRELTGIQPAEGEIVVVRGGRQSDGPLRALGRVPVR
jgi:phosphohistidine phosphatase SixA